MHLQDLAGFVPLDYMALAAISAMVRGNDSDLHQMTSRERLISVNDVNVESLHHSASLVPM